MDMECDMNFIYKKLMYKSSAVSDMVIALCVILTGYLYYYENKKIIYNIDNPQTVNYVIKLIICGVIIVVWFALSMQNGAKKRYSFLGFTLGVWIIPQFIKYAVESVDLTAYTGTAKASILLFIKYVSNINYLSLKTLGDLIADYSNIPYVITLNCLIICFVIMFLTGVIINRRYSGSGELSK